RERENENACGTESYLAHGLSPFWFCSCVSLHDDLAEHALFVVAGDETGEFEFTALGELPNELAAPVRENAFSVRVVMLHVGMFFHDLRMLAVFGNRREDEFVILLAIVVQNETDLFPSAHFDSRGLEAHFSATLEHPDLDDPRRLLRVAGRAGGEASVVLVGGCRKGRCSTRRQDCGACHQQNAEGGERARIFQHADLFPSVSLVVWSRPDRLGAGFRLAGGAVSRGRRRR